MKMVWRYMTVEAKEYGVYDEAMLARCARSRKYKYGIKVIYNL